MIISENISLVADTNTVFFLNKIFQPVMHAITVDHNPGGGHWLAAGLSPQVVLKAFMSFIKFYSLIYLSASTTVQKNNVIYGF